VDGKVVPVVSAELIEQVSEVEVQEAGPGPPPLALELPRRRRPSDPDRDRRGQHPLGQGKREIEAARASSTVWTRPTAWAS